ncbi:MAG TPA: tyrosine-type recombinase/integrase, partial [Bryobacteraceae bacterium]
QRNGWLRPENGSWLLTFREYRWDPEKRKEVGERRTVRIGASVGAGRWTKRQAERIAYEHYLQPLDKRVVLPRSTMTFTEFWSNKYKPHKIDRKMLKLATRMQYQSLWTCWLAGQIGHVRICDLHAEDAQAVIDNVLRQGKSGKTAKSVRIVGSAIFSYAKKLQVASGDNPFSLVELPDEQPVRPARALTWDQCTVLISALPELIKQMVLCAITLSMNVSELRGLKWAHVNLSNEWRSLRGADVVPPWCIAVREHYYYNERGTLKTQKRKRNLPMPKAVQEALAALRKTAKYKNDEEPVFANEKGKCDGKPISDNTVVKHVFRRLPHDLNLSWVTWHTFRHTHATLTKTLGASVHDRMALMGHGSAEMTDRYTHQDYERMREVTEQIAGRILSNSDQQLTSPHLQVINYNGPLQ